ncbi:MAG TPA: hypothetical protein VMW24_07585 [Sedimentisphaerales bacterium]|nr:hypothetical protein [Sedimentisphaerales bacterium]
MRTVSRFLTILLLVPLILGGEAARAYRLTRIAGELNHSANAAYVEFCPEADTPAALSPRTDQNRQAGLNPKKILTIHALACSGILRAELAPSRTHDGVPPCVSRMQLQSHTLFSLRCLLTV